MSEENKYQKPLAGESCVEVPAADIADKEFRKRADKKRRDVGANEDDVEEFLRAVNRCAASGTFSYHEVVRETRGANIDVRRVASLLASWVDVQLHYGRICRVEGVYDYPSFVRI